MPSKQLLVIGTGAAGMSAVSYLDKFGNDGIDCMAFSEKFPPAKGLLAPYAVPFQMVVLVAGLATEVERQHAAVVAESVRQAGRVLVTFLVIPFHQSSSWAGGPSPLVKRILKSSDGFSIVREDELFSVMTAEDGLTYGARMITDFLNTGDLICLGINDLAAAFKTGRSQLVTISRGVGLGHNRAFDAAQEAISQIRPRYAYKKASQIIFKIVGPESLSLMEVNDAARLISDSAPRDVNIIFSVGRDNFLRNEVVMTLIAICGIHNVRLQTKNQLPK